MDSQDTIVAIATPPGRGGIGVVRVSGPNANKISEQLLGKALKPRVATFLPFKNSAEQEVDQGIALYFKAPHSFTGEDVLELQAHGGPVVLDLLVNECIKAGARLANPGEFSLRAFLNDKIDLAQAEAVCDLINANSEQAAQSAVHSLQGEFSDKINKLLKQLTALRIYVEAAIDFPEEEVDFISDSHVTADLATLTQTIAGIYQSAEQGVLLQEGVRVVIAGKPNAGKSSLLNALAKKQSAIVTDIAGTTRDVLREEISLDGLPLHIIDTAGLRESSDPVEKEGIRRALEEIKKANLVLLVVDATNPITVSDLPEAVQQAIRNLPLLQVNNKIDLLGKVSSEQLAGISISAKLGTGIDELKEELKTQVGFKATTEGSFMARRRHLDALSRTLGYLAAAKKQLLENKAGELVAEELKLAQQSLAEITGEFSSDDLLGKIFSEFCIGK